MNHPLGQALPFVHPGLAVAGAVAATIPVIIHIINRRRHKRVPWAAMVFLLAASQRSARRVRLEQVLLMLLRVAVVLLLGLAVARPYLSASAIISPRGTRVHRILAIDNSMSMNAVREDGKTRYQAAMDCAGRLVGSFPETDAVSIVTLGSPAETVIARGVLERRMIRERLATIKSSQRGTDVVGAVTLVRKIIEEPETPAGNHIVYFVSDFTHNLWASESKGSSAAISALQRLADSLPDSGHALNLIQVEPGRSQNVAITGMQAAPPMGLRLPIQVKINVANFGASTVRETALQIRKDGDIVRREVLPRMEPGGTAVATLSIEFASTGTHLLETRLQSQDSNYVADDDVRYLSLEIREATRVLLVDGRPSPIRFSGQADYLAAALGDSASSQVHNWQTNIVQSSRSPVTCRTINASELEAEALGQYDVLALCNVPGLSATLWESVEAFVRDGGGLIVALGDQVNADQYNHFGVREGKGVLPAMLGKTPLQPEKAVSIDSQSLQHPIISEFKDHPQSGMFSARFERYWPVKPEGAAEIVLRFQDKAAALIAGGLGSGRVLLYTSTVNMEWNNLPAKGDYVSLMLGALFHLAPQHGQHRNILVGQTLQESLTPVESSLPLSIRTNDGAFTPMVRSAAKGLVLQYGPVNKSGIIAATIGAESRVFAVNVDSSESDLKVIETSELASALQRPARVIGESKIGEDSPALARSTELGLGLVYFVIALLLIEPWLAMFFSGAKQDKAAERAE